MSSDEALREHLLYLLSGGSQSSGSETLTGTTWSGRAGSFLINMRVDPKIGEPARPLHVGAVGVRDQPGVDELVVGRIADLGPLKNCAIKGWDDVRCSRESTGGYEWQADRASLDRTILQRFRRRPAHPKRSILVALTLIDCDNLHRHDRPGKSE